MDDIKQRLSTAAETCLSSYEAWSGNKKNSEAREALMEAVHEVRKVASRLEIEMAISERDEMAQKPIPIPPHRDAQRRMHESDDMGDDQQPQHNSSGQPPQGNRNQGMQHRRRPYRKPGEGGGNGPRNYPSES